MLNMLVLRSNAKNGFTVCRPGESDRLTFPFISVDDDLNQPMGTKRLATKILAEANPKSMTLRLKLIQSHCSGKGFRLYCNDKIV